MKSMNVFFLGAALCLSSCGTLVIPQSRIAGNGHVREEVRNLSGFQQVHAARSLQVEITQKEAYEVRIEADENLLPYIVTEVSGDQLKITVMDNYQFYNYNKAVVYVSAPRFTRLGVTTSANMHLRGPLNAGSLQLKAGTSSRLLSDAEIRAEEVQIDISTSARAELLVVSPSVSIQTSTSSRLALKGRTDRMNLRMNTSSRVDAENFPAREAEVSGNTSSRAVLQVSDLIKGSLNTSSRIDYRGNPVLDVRCNTSGRIAPL